MSRPMQNTLRDKSIPRMDAAAAAEAQRLATENLKIMAANGELGWPQPWVNADGVTQVSWVPADGSVFDCYVDILGLNNRPMKTGKRV